MYIYIYVCIYIYIYIYTYIYIQIYIYIYIDRLVSRDRAHVYGVATISRLLKIIYIFFAKEPYEKNNILQKRPIILRSLLIVATA